MKGTGGSWIQVALVVKQIRHELAMVEQWRREADDVYHAAEHHGILKGLVELLEVHDCGSTGGFGEGQPRGHHQTLHDRAAWLLGKYGS